MAHKADSSTQGRRSGVSPQTDELGSTLLGDALDMLAAGDEVDVLLAVQDSSGTVASYEFANDGPEACLEGARTRVSELASAGGDAVARLKAPVRYAIVYSGAVADDTGVYQDALILEFGERGWEAYSAYSLVDGIGRGDRFRWTDPAPAGQMEPLL